MAFPFLTLFIIFILWLYFRLRKLDQNKKAVEEEFWAKERAANATMAKDINNLDYLTIPLDKFPLEFSQSPEVKEIVDELTELSSHRLLNLTGVTNTDLKLTYGVPNFDTMCKIGEDFDRVTVLLNIFAKAMVEEENYQGAISILEYAVGVKTDIAESYTLLADCYNALGNSTKLSYLKDTVEQSTLVLKPAILDHIKLYA